MICNKNIEYQEIISVEYFSHEMDIGDIHRNKEENVLTGDNLDNFLTYAICNDDVVDRLDKDINDEGFLIMTDYLPTTDAGNVVFEV